MLCLLIEKFLGYLYFNAIKLINTFTIFSILLNRFQSFKMFPLLFISVSIVKMTSKASLKVSMAVIRGYFLNKCFDYQIVYIDRIFLKCDSM